MKKMLLGVLLTVLALSSCGGSSKGKGNAAANSQVDAAYRAKDYKLLMALADSLRQTGDLSDAAGYYWQGYASDRQMQRRMAGFFWRMSMEAASGSSDADQLDYYAKSASRLTNLLSLRGDYEAALRTAEPAAEHLESLHADSTSDYTNLLIFIGCCQSRFGLPDAAANASYDRAYKMHLDNVKSSGSATAYKNAIAGIINIAYNCIGTSHFNDALTWSDRYGKLLSEYELRDDAQTDYVDKQWARYHIYRATALEGLGREEEAAKAYDDYLRTRFSQTDEGRMEAAEFLAVAGRWDEAADNYAGLDALASGSGDVAPFSLENIQKTELKKFRANKLAGRVDSANAVAQLICLALDSAINQAHRLDIEEQQTIRQKEGQILAQQRARTRERTIYALVVLAVALCAFAAYTVRRRRAAQKLAKEHAGLKTNYDQLEEYATAKERVIHDIQTRLLPKAFPARDDVELSAQLMPAKSMGGDFYDYLLRDDRLFFCVGDVDSRGATAAIAIAVTRALFRTVTEHEHQPDRIVTAINSHLTTNRETTVPIRLTVGVLDLKTGLLCFTNAGNQPLLVVGQSVDIVAVDPNVPVGERADSQYSVQQLSLGKGTVVLVYSDGLIKAEDADHQPYGEMRVKGEALQGLHGLDPAPQALVERMAASVRRFVGTGDLADDLTMLAIRFNA